MKKDDFSHYLIYKVLGINEKEGKNIDIYQNKGRFLYKYAGKPLVTVTEQIPIFGAVLVFLLAKRQKIGANSALRANINRDNRGNVE